MNILERNAKKIVVMAALAASFSAIFTRLINADPIAIGFFRLTFALPFFAIPVLGWHRRALFSVSKKEMLGCALSGVFLFLHFFSWFTSLGYTSVASAVVICSTHPIIIVVLSALVFKEKTNIKTVIGVLIALLGVIIIAGGDYSLAKEALLADFMAFLGAAFLALYFLAGRTLRKNINAAVYVFLVFGFCWLAFTLAMFLTQTPFTSYSEMDYLYLFAMALVCQIGAHAVFNWCLGHVSPLYIATTETGEAICASILAAIIFAEIPSTWQLLGGVITICGLLYYNYQEAKALGNIEKHENVLD